jgi:hypothetical protein
MILSNVKQLLLSLDHMIHFNGERFLGPYPDVTPD